MLASLCLTLIIGWRRNMRLLVESMILRNSCVCFAPKHGRSQRSQIGFVMPYGQRSIFVMTVAKSAVHFGQSLLPDVP